MSVSISCGFHRRSTAYQVREGSQPSMHFITNPKMNFPSPILGKCGKYSFTNSESCLISTRLMVLMEELLFLERDLTSKASVRGCSCVGRACVWRVPVFGFHPQYKGMGALKNRLEAPVLETCPPSSYKLQGLLLLQRTASGLLWEISLCIGWLQRNQ